MTHETQHHGPDDDQSASFARGRPTVAGPFGPLATDLTFRVHPELADNMRFKAAQLGLDMSEYIRDVVYKHETGKSYSKHLSDAVDARERAMFGEVTERAVNVDVVRAMRAGAAR